MYKHALPPDFVLQSQRKNTEDEEKISIEQFIEEERHKLPPVAQLTPVNDTTFKKWRQKRDEELKALEEKNNKQSKYTGREFFQADLFKDDGEEADEEGWDLNEFREELDEIEAESQ